MLQNTSNKPITTDEELAHLIKMNGGATVPSVSIQDYWDKVLVADGYTLGGVQDRILRWSRANVITYKTPAPLIKGSSVDLVPNYFNPISGAQLGLRGGACHFAIA